MNQVHFRKMNLVQLLHRAGDRFLFGLDPTRAD